MESLAQQFLDHLEWLVSRRWFGDKARPVTDLSVDIADFVMCGKVPVILAIVRCEFEWGPASAYFVPILATPGPLPERDATANPAFLEWLVSGFAREREVGGRWRWRRIGDEFPETEGLDYSRAKAIASEQSNTSIVFDSAFIGKVFRKVQPGLNPDLETAEHIMRGGTFHHVPELYGVIELWQDGARTDILAVQQFVANIGDGWSWMLHELAQPERHDALVHDVALLGTRTAEMHLALSADLGDDAFVPETVGRDQAEAIIQRVIAEMERSVEGLSHVLGPERVERLHKGLGAMMGDAWSMVGTALIRVHGDYHLGQTLRTHHGDFAIIDFEGEPSRSMDERRQKLPALKDVAGMLRSLDYAAATLTQQYPEQKQELADWVETASDAFVAAYRQAITATTVPLVPTDDAAFASVLNLMIAEKALYETRYEMNNRPDWLGIPLGALLRLVGIEEG